MADQSPVGKTARAGWDFQPSRPDELALEEDDLLVITKVSDSGWWEGELNGNVGWFPCNYVEILSDEEAQMAYQQVSVGTDAMDIDSNKNKEWYSQYRNGAAADEAVPERKVEGRITRVILASPSDAKPKWYDKVSGEALNKLSDKEKKRQEVIFELIETEKDFVRDLDIIINVFLEPLRKKKIVNAKDLAVLFSNVEQLVPVNMELLRSLETRRSENPVIELVGDIFVRLCDYFKMYNMYCSNHPFSLVKFQNIQTKAFKAFVAEAYLKPECRNLDMCSFLIKPVQRICKYPLLIREILKCTESNHKDFNNLEQAFEKIEMVVTIVNEATRQAEAVQKTLNIQNRFAEKVQFLTPSRKLLRDEELVQLSDGKRKIRTIFLFNDLLVIAKEAGMMAGADKLRVVDMIPLDTALINDPDAESPNFEVTHSGHSKFLFDASSPEAKKKWVEQLTELAEEEFERVQMELENLEEYDDTLEDLPEEPSRGSLDTPTSRLSTGSKFGSKENVSVTLTVPTTTVASPSSAPTTPTGASSNNRFSTASTLQQAQPRTPKGPQPQEQAPDLTNLKANLRKTTYEKPGVPVPTTPTNEEPNNEAQAALQRLRRVERTTSEPAVSKNEETPEFLKVKLRKTIYEDGINPAADPMQKSKSLTALDEPIQSEKKAKKKGFMANLFARFRRKKSKGKEPEASGEASTSKRESQSVPSTPTSPKGGQPSWQQPQQQQPGQPSTPTSPTRGGPSSRPPSAALQQPGQQQPGQQRPAGQRPPGHAAKRISTVSASAVANAGKVVTIAVRGFKKVDGPKPDYVYTIEVIREKATYQIQKTYDDFFNFHTGLIFQFPEEAGRRSQKRTLPDLPPQTVFVSESIAAQRRLELNRYLIKLFQHPEKISASAYAIKFLEPKEGVPAGAASKAPTPAGASKAPAAGPSSSSSSSSSAPASNPSGARLYREKTLPKPQAPTRPKPPPPSSAPPKLRP